MLKRIISFIICLFAVVNGWAVDDGYETSIIEQARADSLKTKYNLREAEYVCTASRFKYIRLVTEDGKEVVADSLGHLLIAADTIELRGYDIIDFNKTQNGDDVGISSSSSSQVSIIRSQECFVAVDENCHLFYDLSGNLINTFTCLMTDCGSYYLCSADGAYGIVSDDGELLLQMDYESIEDLGDCFFKIKKRVNGIVKEGIVSITDKVQVVIPCEFYKVSSCEGK